MLSKRFDVLVNISIDVFGLTRDTTPRPRDWLGRASLPQSAEASYVQLLRRERLCCGTITFRLASLSIWLTASVSLISCPFAEFRDLDALDNARRRVTFSLLAGFSG